MEKSIKNDTSELALMETSDSCALSQSGFGVTSTTLFDNSLNSLLPLSSSDKLVAEQSLSKTDHLHSHYHLINHQRHHYDSNGLTVNNMKMKKKEKMKNKTTVCKTEFIHSVLTAINEGEHQANTEESENTKNLTETMLSEEEEEKPMLEQSATTSSLISLPHYSFLVQFAPFYEMAIHEIIVECERRVANAPLKDQENQTVHLRGTSNVSLNISTHSFDTPSSYLPSMVSTAIYYPSVTTTTTTETVQNTNSNTQNTNSVHSLHVNKLQNPCHSYSLPMEQHTLTSQPTFLPCYGPHESILSLFTSLSRITYQEYYCGNKVNTQNVNISAEASISDNMTSLSLETNLPHFCSPLVLIAGLAYLAKVALRCQCDYASVTWSNWYRLTTTALLIAWKMYKDDANGHSQSHVNAIFAQAANLPLGEMNQRELDFLYLVDFDLLLEEREVVSWVDWMERIAMRSGLKLSLWALVSQQEQSKKTYQNYQMNNTSEVVNCVQNHIKNNNNNISNYNNIYSRTSNYDDTTSSSNMSLITATTLPWEKNSNVQSVFSFLTATDTTLVPLTHRSSITSLCQTRENNSVNHVHGTKNYNNNNNNNNNMKNDIIHMHERVQSPLTQLSDANYTQAWSVQTGEQEHKDKPPALITKKENERLFSVVYGWEPPSPTMLNVDGHAPTLWDLAHAAFLPVPDDDDDDDDEKRRSRQCENINEEKAIRNKFGVVEERPTTSPVSFFHKAHQMLHKGKHTTKKCKLQNRNNVLCSEMCYESDNNNNNNASGHSLCTPHDYMANPCNSNNTAKKPNTESSATIDVIGSNNCSDDNNTFLEQLQKLQHVHNNNEANKQLANQIVMGTHRDNNKNKELQTSHEPLLKPQKDMKRTGQNSGTRSSLLTHCNNAHNATKASSKLNVTTKIDKTAKNGDDNSKTTRRRWAPFGVVQRVREAFDITTSLMRGELNVLVRDTHHKNEDNHSSSNVTPSVGSNSSKKNSPSSLVETSQTHSTTEVTPERSNDDSRTLNENDLNVNEMMIFDNTTCNDKTYQKHVNNKSNNNNSNNSEKNTINDALLVHNTHQVTSKVQVAPCNNHTRFTVNLNKMTNNSNNNNKNIEYKIDEDDCYDDNNNDVDSEMDILTENEAEYANFYEYYEDELGYPHYGYEDDALSELPSSDRQENYKSNLNTNNDSTDYASYEENELDEMSNEQFSSDANKEDNINENDEDSDGFSDYNYHYMQRPPPMTHSPPSL